MEIISLIILIVVFLIFFTLLILWARREAEVGLKSIKSVPLSHLTQKQLRRRLKRSR